MDEYHSSNSTETDPLIDKNPQRIPIDEIQHLAYDSYESVKSFFSDFQTWLHKSSALDVGFGLIIGGIFQTLMQSFLQDIITPPLGLALGSSLRNIFIVLKAGPSNNTYLTLEEAQADGAVTENVGSFLENFLQFFLVSLILYWLVRGAQRFRNKMASQAHKLEQSLNARAIQQKTCPECFMSVNDKARRCQFCTSFLGDGIEQDHQPMIHQ